MYKILYEQKEWCCATKPLKKEKIFWVIFLTTIALPWSPVA
jgi:hypothetical protein